MRKILVSGLLMLAFALRGVSQDSLYHITYDQEGNKVLVGLITESLLANDPAFSWFYTGVNGYFPDSGMVRYISAYRDSFNLVVFCGTWCPDTWHVIPEFYRVMIASSYPLNRILLYGVDRNKKALDKEAAQFHITEVPTIILLHNGREVGRIVESPQKSVETDIVALIYKMMRREGRG